MELPEPPPEYDFLGSPATYAYREGMPNVASACSIMGFYRYLPSGCGLAGSTPQWRQVISASSSNSAGDGL